MEKKDLKEFKEDIKTIKEMIKTIKDIKKAYKSLNISTLSYFQDGFCWYDEDYSRYKTLLELIETLEDGINWVINDDKFGHMRIYWGEDKI